MNYALSLCLLISTSITVTMEIVRSSSQESFMCVEKIYSSFVNNQHTEAKKVINSNDNDGEKMTLSLLKHGIKQNNANFIQWFLAIKQLPSNNLALQKALEHSQNCTNEAANILREHVELQQDLEKYTEIELEKISQAIKSLPTKSNLSPRKGWLARQAAPGEKESSFAKASEDRLWEEKMKNAQPIPEEHFTIKHDGTWEYVTEKDDCDCIVL